MTELMNEFYYMISERVDQQNMRDKEVKLLMARKCALADEIIFRLGEDGDNLLDELTDLDSRIEAIRDKTLFQAALRFGTEIRETAVS